MWYSFELVTGLRERSDRTRIYAEIRQYLTYCIDEGELQQLISSAMSDIVVVDEDVQIFDNLHLEMKSIEDQELCMIDGFQLPVKARSIKRLKDFFAVKPQESYPSFEISHFVLVFECEKEFDKFVSNERSLRSTSAKIFQDPDRYFLTVIN